MANIHLSAQSVKPIFQGRTAYEASCGKKWQYNIDEKEDIIPGLENRLLKAAGLFRKHKKLSAFDYQTLTGLGRTKAVDDLNQLIQFKVIKRTGGGRSTVYELGKG